MVTILLLYFVYIVLMTHDGEALIPGSSIGIFQKSTDTRFVIWVHLLATIQDNILWGVGSLNSTVQASPLAYLDFTMNRKNLSAHSLYFELIYRLGIVGLFLFLGIILALWTSFWKGRNVWEIKIAASVLIAILFLASAQIVIIFAAMELRWGFVWLFFGIAFGSTLRKSSIDSNITFNNNFLLYIVAFFSIFILLKIIIKNKINDIILILLLFTLDPDPWVFHKTYDPLLLVIFLLLFQDRLFKSLNKNNQNIFALIFFIYFTSIYILYFYIRIIF